MRSFRDAKAMATTLRQALADKNTEITHGHALELVAAQFGCADWNVLAARIAAEDRSGAAKRAESEAIGFDEAIPIIRIFDVVKAREFYLGFLRFAVDWEHRFGEGMPLYMQVSRAGLVLHLSEHHGDASPGSTTFVRTRGIRALHAELISAHYSYMRPGLEEVDWGLELTVHDPFGNRLRFCEGKDG